MLVMPAEYLFESAIASNADLQESCNTNTQHTTYIAMYTMVLSAGQQWRHSLDQMDADS